MFLDRIVDSTRLRVAQRKKENSLAGLERRARSSPAALSFEAALKTADFGLIAEIKRASPSKGILAPKLDVEAQAKLYEKSGVSAISVLTEPDFFLGSYDDLAAVRRVVNLPLLAKDFNLDPCQIYDARIHGADAVLLIAAILSPPELISLLEVTHGLGMSALVEVHNKEEVGKAVSCGARIMGINNRDLKDFTVDLNTTLNLCPLVPPSIIVVSESGIHSAADVKRLREAGVKAILLGEALVTSPDPVGVIRELLGKK